MSRKILRMNLSLSVVVLASVALALGGCGSSASSSSGVAHLSSNTSGSSPTSDGGSSSPESSASTQQKLVAYSQCMRTHGVPEFPEPTEGRLLIHSSDHNGHVTGVNPQSAQFQAAQKACAKLQPEGGKPSPQMMKQAQERALKFSACMRSHGEPNFPEPEFSGGGTRLTLKAGGKAGSPGAIDPNSPQFRAAQKACEQYFGPPGSKGGPVAVPSGGSGGGGSGSSSQESVGAP